MKLPRWIFTASLALILTGASTGAWAADSIGERVFLKGARGLDNTVLGLIAEWPKTMYYDSKEHGIPYGMTVGFAEGLAVGLARTGVGIYELATFPIPYPANYEPILSPQFSLDPQPTRIAP